MRMNINHATKAGVTVHEYKVLEKRAPAIDKEFNRITNEWLEVKKSGMLQFTMGTVGLENPMEQTLFLCTEFRWENGCFHCLCTISWQKRLYGGCHKAWQGCSGGVMETIIYQAFQVFKEGIGYCCS